MVIRVTKYGVVLVEKHHSFMHRHLHGDSASGALLHSVFHSNNGSSIAEGTVKVDFLGLYVTLATRDPLTIRVHNEKPATEFENPLTIILPFAQAHDVMLDVATGAFEGERFQGHSLIYKTVPETNIKAVRRVA